MVSGLLLGIGGCRRRLSAHGLALSGQKRLALALTLTLVDLGESGLHGAAVQLHRHVVKGRTQQTLLHLADCPGFLGLLKKKVIYYLIKDNVIKSFHKLSLIKNHS